MFSSFHFLLNCGSVLGFKNSLMPFQCKICNLDNCKLIQVPFFKYMFWRSTCPAGADQPSNKNEIKNLSKVLFTRVFIFKMTLPSFFSASAVNFCMVCKHRVKWRNNMLSILAKEKKENEMLLDLCVCSEVRMCVGFLYGMLPCGKWQRECKREPT